MKVTLRIFSIALLFGGYVVLANGLSGCASGAGSTVTPPATDTNIVTFHSTSTASYRQDSLIATGGEHAVPDGTTISQSTISTSATIQGHANSTIVQNIYTPSTTATDSDYYYQATNDDLYKVDFGLEALNNIAALQSFLGGKVHVGWVLEAKLGAAVGTQWTAIDTSITAGTLGQLHLVDQASMMADSSITLAGKAYHVRHAHHSFTATAGLGTASGVFDVYFSPALGCPMIVQIHPLTYTTAIGPGGTQAGIQNVLTAHN